MSPQVQLDMEKLTDFCQRWGVSELALFGSVLREDFRPESDIDVLVSFLPDARRDLFDLVDMQDELETIFGRHVDLVMREGIERSYNHIRKNAILESAEVLYAA